MSHPRRSGTFSAMLVALAVAVLTLSVHPATASSGELDLSFGTGGVLSTDFGGTYDWAYAGAVQPDGKIVAAGVSNSGGTYDFALARYRPDGSVDPSFGIGGGVVTDFGGSYDWAYALALQPDGRILVGGVTDASGSRDFVVARYATDGSLDRSFGENGRFVGNLSPLSADTIYSLALQPDGKILAAGISFPNAVTLRPNGDFMLARYTSDGAPDPTFGVLGVVTTDFSRESWDEPHALALQPDGSILLGGSTNSGNGPGVLFGADQLALARYTAQGCLDGTFGDGGKVVVDGGTMVEAIRALALRPDGKIVAAGFVNGEHRGDMLLAQFDHSGAPDRAFGTDGFTVTAFGSRSERLEGVGLQPDGRIVAAGQVATGPDADFAAVRYDSGGHLDRSFGHDGLATFDFQSREDRVHALVLQADGGIVAVGQSETDFALARFDSATR